MRKKKEVDGVSGKSIPTSDGKWFQRELEDISNREAKWKYTGATVEVGKKWCLACFSIGVVLVPVLISI